MASNKSTLSRIELGQIERLEPALIERLDAALDAKGTLIAGRQELL